jgi:probable rRNA maturation factor
VRTSTRTNSCQVHIANSQSRYRLPRERIQRVVLRTLRRGHVTTGQLSIACVGIRRMRRLNRDYHHVDAVTDVLAFDLALPGTMTRGYLCGEVVVAPAVAAQRAPTYRQTYQDELMTYIVHGILHLLGYTDSTLRGRRTMELLQQQLIV